MRGTWFIAGLLFFGCAERTVDGPPSPVLPPSPALEKQQVIERPRVLALGAHFPNRAENEASGAILGRVTRTAPAFAGLVRSESPMLVFKDEESTGADRLMSPGLRVRLEALAGLVGKEWPGLRLRITEAWDENGEHGENSLHYEGRAADVTASDRDAQRLPRLAGLAIECGFDWVSNEGSHVHASVRR